jgi:hypothetical protein
MDEERLLTPREAEAVVEDRIERFGLGALPRVSVTAGVDGLWQVRWEHLSRPLAPMTRGAWCARLEENVGSLDAGDLETTEA